MKPFLNFRANCTGQNSIVIGQRLFYLEAVSTTQISRHRHLPYFRIKIQMLPFRSSYINQVLSAIDSNRHCIFINKDIIGQQVISNLEFKPCFRIRRSKQVTEDWGKYNIVKKLIHTQLGSLISFQISVKKAFIKI